MVAKKTKRPSISDAAVKAKTGKGWTEWFAILDKWGAKKKPHTEIATHLYDKLGVPGWWCQMVAVEYERARGLRKVGETAAQGFSVDVQRTVKASAQEAWDRFLQPKHVSKWFIKRSTAQLRVGGRYRNADGEGGEYLALTPPKRARMTWENPTCCPGTILEMTILPAGVGKVAVRVTHSRLKTQKDRSEMKDGWSWAMDSYKSYLETGKPIKYEDWAAER